MAPVELVGFSRSKAQRHIGRHRLTVCFAPALGVAAHGVVAALVAVPAQFFENPDQRQAFARWLLLIRCQQLIEPILPRPNPRKWLDFSFIAKLGRLRTDNLADGLPRQSQFSADRLDRLALYEIRPPNLPNRLHNQHPCLGFQESWKSVWTPCPGVPIGCRLPRKRGPYCMPIHRYWRSSQTGPSSPR